jgi:uncharacterized protein
MEIIPGSEDRGFARRHTGLVCLFCCFKEGIHVTLEQFFHEHPKAALAFSGGVDSAYLLWAGLQAGAEVWPYFVKTPFQPRFELEDAYRLCEQLDVDLIVLDYDVLTDETVVSNPPDRCYHCKRWMFSKLKRYAASEGFSLLLDGTNASDDGGDRPGMRALAELEVRSPLRECGLTKERIRELSRQAGLFTWDKPSYACLATRIPAGRRIDREDLERVEQGETTLAALGLRDFRLRLTAGGCRLQVLESQFPLVMKRRADILSALEADFSEVTLDLRPRVPID